MKRNIILISLLLTSALSACNRGQTDWQSFKDKYAADGTTIHLNGLMKLGMGLFANNSDPDTQALMRFLKKMKGIEINIIPQSQAHYTPAEVDRLSQLLNHSHYESLINIRKGSRLFNLWARGKEDEFSDPLALINDGNDVIMVEMKGTLTTQDIQSLTNAGMKYSSKEINGE
ncbi:MAG: DUF4252 domain-containing protein [Chitinophagaceae bacterium]|nr:MAG: DUF4252 domain-containing protein [Chitinophagaceae bacterium]